MEPVKSLGASVDTGVLRRLKRLDKQLRVTFSLYSLDTRTGRPIIIDGTVMNPDTGLCMSGAVLDPAHYLWRKDSYSSHHFFVRSYPIEQRFGHEAVMHLEADIARHRSPAEAWRFMQAMTERNRNRMAKSHKQYLKDKVAANASLGLDIARGKRTSRTATAVSYPGQRSHTSSAETGLISMSNRELGIEE